VFLLLPSSSVQRPLLRKWPRRQRRRGHGRQRTEHVELLVLLVSLRPRLRNRLMLGLGVP